MDAKTLFNIKFCSQCGERLGAKMVAKDGSIICLKCRTIEDAKTQGQGEILRLARKLEDLESQVPFSDADIEDESWVEENIYPIERELANALRLEYNMDEDVATERSQEGHNFEEWVNLVQSGSLERLPKDESNNKMVTFGINLSTNEVHSESNAGLRAAKTFLGALTGRSKSDTKSSKQDGE